MARHFGPRPPRPPREVMLPPWVRERWAQLQAQLEWRYGPTRAWAMLMEEDEAIQADLLSWRLLGRNRWPPREGNR